MLQVLKNYYHLVQAVLANCIYGFPSKKLKVIAITGTDGKTTTTTLLYHMLKSAGYKVALISTVAAYINTEQIDTGFHVTTPSPFAIQKLLKRIVNSDSEFVILETTSHGIDQNRIWGIQPTYAAVTNVTHEHLDYHHTYANYLETKSRLLLLAKHSYINADAKESAHLLEAILKENGVTRIESGTVQPEPETHVYEVISASELSSKLKSVIHTRFGHESYNYENVAIASAIAREVGVKEKDVVAAISKFPGVPGRMEEVVRSKGIRFIVDFAHTPAALEQALTVQKNHTKKSKGKLLVIFGCAGLRDHTKRPLMGEIAARIADLVILTAEDPRTEDVWSIIAQIKSGVSTGKHAKILSIADRAEAIAFAYTNLARSGDTILVTGKGHEKSMCYGTVEYPYSDQETILKIVA